MSEPISVIVSFSGTHVIPTSFTRSGRTVHVTHVNLIHHERHGRDKVYFFSVSDNANAYRLSFSTETLAWRLEEMESS